MSSRTGGFARAALALVGWCLASVTAAAEVVGSSLDFTRVPLSVNQVATAGSYGTYDAFKVFNNPAFLAYQPKALAVGLTAQSRMAGEQTVQAVAVSWAGQPTAVGTYGLALMVSTYSAEPFQEIDMFANETGLSIAPKGWHAGAAGMFQWKFVSLGGGYRMASEAYGIPGLADKSVGMVDAGTAISLGTMTVGAAYRGIGTTAVIAVGGSIKADGRFKATVGGEWNIPLGGVSGYGGGGVSWAAMKWLSVEAGLHYRGGGTMATMGISLPLRAFLLNAAMAAPLTHDLGIGSYVGGSWMHGRDRAEPEGPKLFLEDKERTLAVMNFDAQNAPAGDAAVVTELLRSQLVKEGAFNIIEKANMEKVLSEQAFQQTGCTSQECAVKLGKILNVRFLVAGSFGKAMGRYLVTMRVIEVQTAKIIYTDEAEGGTLTEVREGIRVIGHRLTEAVKSR